MWACPELRGFRSQVRELLRVHFEVGHVRRRCEHAVWRCIDLETTVFPCPRLRELRHAVISKGVVTGSMDMMLNAPDKQPFRHSIGRPVTRIFFPDGKSCIGLSTSNISCRTTLLAYGAEIVFAVRSS